MSTERMSADGTLSMKGAIDGVVDLFPGADRQALQCLGELLCKTATSPGAAGDAEQALSDDTIEAIVYAVLNTGHIDSAKAAVRAVLEGEHAP